MAAGFSTTLRNNMLNQITTQADSGATAALLRVYEGTRPATGASVGASTLLVEQECEDPFAPGAAAGLLEPTIPAPATIGTSGLAEWWRLVNSSGTFVMDGDVGIELFIDFPNLVAAEPFTITGFSISAGNA
jgi:hypothetical protein